MLSKPRRGGLWTAHSILSSLCQISPTLSPSPLLSIQALGFLGCPSLGLVARTGRLALAFAVCYLANRCGFGLHWIRPCLTVLFFGLGKCGKEQENGIQGKNGV